MDALLGYNPHKQLQTEMLHQHLLDVFSSKAVFNVINNNIIIVGNHRDKLC